jgi:hypothetical protein
MRTSVKARRLGAGALLGGVVLSVASASCASSGIVEVFTTTGQSDTDLRSEFFVGEPVTCQARVSTARQGMHLDYRLRVLEIDGQSGNFGLFNLGTVIQDKVQRGLADPMPLPRTSIQARLDHPARIVTAPDAVDDPTGIALAQDIHDTLVEHMRDPLSHKDGRIDPTVALIEAGGNCSKIDPAPTKEGCPAQINFWKAIFARHIGDPTYHEVPDTLHNIASSDALIQDQGQPPPPLPLVQVSFYPLAREFKYKLTGHIFNVREEPVLVPGRFRCEVTLDNETKSADFTVLPGPKQKPPTDPSVPKQNFCTIDTVPYCPDPNKGPNVYRCCSFDGSCGTAPKGIAVCNPNP